MIRPKRSVVMTISKNMFASLAYWKDITYKRGKNGLVERNESEKENQLRLILKGLTPGMIAEKTATVVQMLNETEGTIVPISGIVVTG